MEIIPMDRLKDDHDDSVISRFITNNDWLFGQDAQPFQDGLVLIGQFPFLIFTGVMNNFIGLKKGFLEKVYVHGVCHGIPCRFTVLFQSHFKVKARHEVKSMIDAFTAQKIGQVKAQGKDSNTQERPRQVGFAPLLAIDSEKSSKHDKKQGAKGQLPRSRC